MTWYEGFCILGVPTLLIAVGRFCYTQLAKSEQNHRAVQAGIQALLRSQMIRDYNKYMPLGYAPIYAKENFENCWVQYHALGLNGVMDELRERFLGLPTEGCREDDWA